MAMTTCCFCFDLKHGTNASATFTLVTRILLIIIFSAVLGVVHKANKDSNQKIYEYEETYQLKENKLQLRENELQLKKNELQLKQNELLFIDVYLGVIIGMSTLGASFSIMLLIGVKKSIKRLFLPWIIAIGMEISGSILFFIKSLFMINLGGIYYPVGLLIGALFNSYMLWCVITYYKTLTVTNTQSQHFSIESNQAISENPPPYKFEKDTTPMI